MSAGGVDGPDWLSALAWGFPGSAHCRPRAPLAGETAYWPEPRVGAGGAGARVPSPCPYGSSSLKLESARPACWRGHRAAEGVWPWLASAERAGAGGDRAAATGPESRPGTETAKGRSGARLPSVAARPSPNCPGRCSLQSSRRTVARSCRHPEGGAPGNWVSFGPPRSVLTAVRTR